MVNSAQMNALMIEQRENCISTCAQYALSTSMKYWNVDTVKTTFAYSVLEA